MVWAWGRVFRVAAKAQAAVAEASSVAQQSLSLVRVVRAHANESHERRRFVTKVFPWTWRTLSVRAAAVGMDNDRGVLMDHVQKGWRDTDSERMA